MAHSKTPWRVGRAGAVVTDDPEPLYVGGGDAVDYYGGYLIAESIGKSNADFIVLACNAHDALVEALQEAMSGDLPYPSHVLDMAEKALKLAGAEMHVKRIKIEIRGKVGSRDVGAFCAHCKSELFGEEVFHSDINDFVLVLEHPGNSTCRFANGLYLAPTTYIPAAIVAEQIK